MYTLYYSNEPRSARKPLKIADRPGPLAAASSSVSAFPQLSDLTPRSPRTGSPQPGLSHDRTGKSESRSGTPQLSQPRRRRPPPRVTGTSRPAPSPLGYSLGSPETKSTVIFLDDVDDDEDETSGVIVTKPSIASDLPTPVTISPRSGQQGLPKRRTTRTARLVEQARREQYAQSLFDELNRDVFGGALPAETKLNWNKRLLTTAGRAKWHRCVHSRFSSFFLV
jgi:hypothetical protein